MRILIAAFTAALLTASTASTSSAQTTFESIGRAVFSAAERQLIEEFFGRSATPAERILIDAAKDIVTTAVTGEQPPAPEQEYKAEDEEGGHKKWKKQKHKNKGRGQGRGKGKNKGMPPGLAKKKQLPPGLRKRLAKHGSLPPGLAKRDLPVDLETHMPPPVQGTERIVVGNDVALVDIATNVVLDVLYDVVTGAR